MSIYKMFASAAGGTENGLAQLDIQFDGEIVAMLMSLLPEGALADGDAIQAEMSFLSSSTLAVNDARGSLLQVNARYEVITSGTGLFTVAERISGVRIPISAGERVFLHANNSAGAQCNVSGYLYTVDRGDVRLRRRR